MNEHCCACTVVCHHVGSPNYCAKHADFNERCLQWVEGYKQSPEANKHVGRDFKDYMKEEKEWETKHWRYTFSGHVLQALMSTEDASDRDSPSIAAECVILADALIAELEKKKKEGE